MTLTGSTGYPQFVGVYERSEKTAHGAPFFVKKAGDKTHYLYRYTDGKWKFAISEAGLTCGWRDIESSKPADLPSEAGLSWTYWDGPAITWKDDPAITCAAGEEAAAAWVVEQEAEAERLAAVWANAEDKVGLW